MLLHRDWLACCVVGERSAQVVKQRKNAKVFEAPQHTPCAFSFRLWCNWVFEEFCGGKLARVAVSQFRT